MNKQQTLSAILLAALAIAISSLLYARGGDADSTLELWAGHQAVFGEKKVPFLGRQQTRSDYYVLAEVRRSGSAIDLVQRSCESQFRKVGGIQTSMTKDTLNRLPPARISFVFAQQKGKAAPWQVGWASSDLDGDGKPGVTVRVDSPLCDGDLYVASESISEATATLTEQGMIGDVIVRSKQKILGADSLCLRWFSSDSEQTERGAFAYRRVADDATCESLLREGWPVRAAVERYGKGK